MAAVSFFMDTQFIFMHAAVRIPRRSKKITDNPLKRVTLAQVKCLFYFCILSVTIADFLRQRISHDLNLNHSRCFVAAAVLTVHGVLCHLVFRIGTLMV